MGTIHTPSQSPMSWIESTFLKVTTSPTLSIVIQERTPVVVLAVERYLAQNCAGNDRSRTGSAPDFCYDLTLSDGVYKEKWHLAPSLNFLVQKNIIKCSTEVTITQCSYVYDEKRVGWGFVCIEELECGGEVLEPKMVHFRQKEQAKKPEVPLLGGGRYYLSLWNNEDPYGDVWLQSKPPDEQLSLNAFKIVSLSDLEITWKNRAKYPPLLVRILHKSRLRYFGKPNRKSDVPYQAYFEVADHSGMMSMVLWNSMCPEWFQSLRIGTVLLLQKYVVKSTYTSRTLPAPRDPRMKIFTTIELGLNSQNPSAIIHIIPEKEVKAEWNLPEVKYHFITRSELNSLPHNHSCDVIGLVTFVGRAERQKKKDDGEDFWLYRWVHAIDGTSEEPFELELFATSQPDIFDNIHPMSYLVCTQMRVIRDSATNTSARPYLTTSNESEMFITGFHRGQPYARDAKVKRFIQWTKTQKEAELLEKCAIGGHYHYPPLPDAFSQYCKDSRVETVLTTFAEMKKEIGELHYREHKRIAVQGIIAAIRYISNDNADAKKGVTGLEDIEIGESVGSPSLLSGERHEGEVRWGHNKRDHLALSSLHSWQEHQNSSKRRKSQHDSETQQLNPVLLNEWSLDEESIEPDPGFIQPDEQRITETSGEREVYQGIWESELWSQVKHNLMEHLRYSVVLSESIARQFDYTHKEFLMQQYNIQPAKYVPKNYQSKKTVQEFKAANCSGHYILTILGKNVKSIHDLNRLHLICILDICHLGNDHVEIGLNKIYNPAEEADAANQHP
ncbi:RPA-related protein RADX isoform X2 [Ambystoma mexicanum]|uniref:RPA-related protein RADX isoform X2 n=1 Tax=Ambystoma mexicanum TaxID=8296 RepID=UPI0037E74E6F